MSPAVEDEVRNNVKGTIYEKLPVGPGQIRLLTISTKKDGEEDDAQLRCTLKTVPLDGKTRYTALSYTWGHESDIVDIVVNEEPFEATANLHAALEHFRNNQVPTTLWVDAICINQKHDGEKGEQVQLMQDIFSGAEKTWVWLGIEADKSSMAGDLINELYRSACREGNASPESADKIQWGSLNIRGLEDKLIALEHLLTRDYWYRVWVVQEIALSKKLTLFCGDHEFSWESLLFTAYFLNIQIDVWIDQSLSRKRNPTRGILGGTQRILSIQSVRHDFQEKLRSELRDSLLFLLSNHRHTGATNEKDKYIALSGLTQKGDKGQLTDNSKTARAASTPTCPTCGSEKVKVMDNLYDKSKRVGDVYTLACESLTKEQQRHPPLDFLDCAGPPRKFQMPSWVPDWSVILGRPSPLLYWQLATKQHDDLVPINAPGASLLRYSDFAAKKQNEPAPLNAQDGAHPLNKLTFSIQKNGLLWARGRKLDSIKGLNIVQTSRIERSEDQKAVHSVQPKAPEYPIHERPSDVLWKTIVLNRTRTAGLKAPDNWGEIFYNYLSRQPISPTPSFLHQWWAQSKHVKLCGSTLEEIAKERQLSIPEQIPNSDDALEHFKTAFTNAVGYRKLAPTERGSLGLVPLEAKPGDVVVILADCSAPVLLRWREIEEDYEFIGTCYVHGIMQGEAMTGLDAEERISEEFYIR